MHASASWYRDAAPHGAADPNNFRICELPTMWWQDEKLKTPEQRAIEIAELTRRRNRILERAPMSAVSAQLVRALIVVFVLILSLQRIMAGGATTGNWMLLAIFGVAFLAVLYEARYFPPLSDRWALSRLVGYEGDSPQDLQKKIDRLTSEAESDKTS
jgi:hypothetical protein